MRQHWKEEAVRKSTELAVNAGKTGYPLPYVPGLVGSVLPATAGGVDFQFGTASSNGRSEPVTSIKPGNTVIRHTAVCWLYRARKLVLQQQVHQENAHSLFQFAKGNAYNLSLDLLSNCS